MRGTGWKASMKRLRRLLRWSVLLTLLACLAAFAMVGWHGSARLVSPPRRELQDYHREILARPDEHGLRIHSFEAGTTPCLLVTAARAPRTATKSRLLRGELARRGQAPPWEARLGTIVMLYGHGGRKEDHLPICERFCAAGFRCVLPDLPGQGDHPEAVARFGRAEVELAGQVLDEAARHFDFDPGPAFLFGVSQGGAIALQTAAHAPGKWRAVASVAAFSSLDRPLARAAENLLPQRLAFCRPLATFAVACGTKFRAGFWPAEIRPVEAARNLHLPVMIVHGDQDRDIDPGQAREIHTAVPDPRKELRLVAGADHGRVLAVGSTGLYADLCRFFLAAAKPSVPTPAAASAAAARGSTR
jgi:pimeloyl-ACP methyl ester carboxylesterase